MKLYARNNAVNGLYFYPKPVQERAIALGLTNVETVARRRKQFLFGFSAAILLAAVAAQMDAASNPFQWDAEVILGWDAEEYTILYHQCGLCALGRQEGLSYPVPYMCALDTMY